VHLLGAQARASAGTSEGRSPGARLRAVRAQLEEHVERADGFARDLASAREAVERANTSAVEHKQGREQERERADALARDLAAVRQEVVSITARFTAKGAEGLKTVQAMAEEADDTQQVQAEHEGVEALALHLRAAEETKVSRTRSSHSGYQGS
jgi:hypothetical protein